MTTRVLFMGTEACGKTVLLAVLAHKYQAFSEDGYFLEAINKEAHDFTNRSWDCLCEKGEWPPATPPGALHGFVWRLHRRPLPISGTDTPTTETIVDLNMADFAGEVFRKAFGKGDASSDEAKQLISFIDNTDGVICLVNLQEIIDEQDIERKSETEWAIKNLIDHARKRLGIPALLVFTKADRYEAVLERDGFDPQAVVRRHLQQVAGAHPDIQALFVSAVDSTICTPTADGLVEEKPAPNFGDRGIPELLGWISKVRAKPNPPPIPVKNDLVVVSNLWPWLRTRKAIVMLVALSIAFMFALCYPTTPPPPPPPPPLPIVFSSGPNWFGTRWVKVENTGNMTLQVAITACGNRREVTLPPNYHIKIAGSDDPCDLIPGDLVAVSAPGYASQTFRVP